MMKKGKTIGIFIYYNWINFFLNNLNFIKVSIVELIRSLLANYIDLDWYR